MRAGWINLKMNWHHFCRHKQFLSCLGSSYSMSMKQSGMLAKMGLFRTSACVVIHASLPTSIFYWPLSFQRRRNDFVFSSLSFSAQSLWEKLMMEPRCLIHRSQDCSRETSLTPSGGASICLPARNPSPSTPCRGTTPALSGQQDRSWHIQSCVQNWELHRVLFGAFWTYWTRYGPRNRHCWRQQAFHGPGIACLTLYPITCWKGLSHRWTHLPGALGEGVRHTVGVESSGESGWESGRCKLKGLSYWWAQKMHSNRPVGCRLPACCQLLWWEAKSVERPERSGLGSSGPLNWWM